MRTHILAFFILIAIAGCTTVDFVRKETVPHRQGILRHSPPSDAKKAEKYRQEVAKKASDFCNGKYQITKEYQAEGSTSSSTGVGTGLSVGAGAFMVGTSRGRSDMYNFVEFSCLESF